MSDGENPLEFSARDLMPDWAQEKSKDQSKTSAKRFGGDDGGDKSRGGGGDRRGGDRRGGGQRGGDDRRGGYGGGGDRRGGGQGNRFGGGQGGGRSSGGGRGGDRRGGDRRGGDRRGGGDFERNRPEPLPAGISATLEPSQPAVEGLVRHIKQTFRSFPVSDLAKMIVQERERYDIHFKAEAGKAKLFQCLADKSLWLTKEEAVAHILNSPAIEEYYTVEEVDVGAPTGNFSAIAVCGMSGTLLGPSNHHEYQKNIVRLHRERFSNMPIDRLKSRIRMENDEETIEKWKEQVSKTRHYRLKGEEEVVEEVVAEEPAEAQASESEGAEAVVTDATVEEDASNEASETVEAVESDAPESAEEVVADAPEEVPVESAAEDSSEDAVSEEVVAEEPAEEEAPAPAADELVLKSQEELAQHFREHFAAEVIAEVSEVLIPGNVSAKDLSAGLLSYVKQEGEKLRRGFPLPMIQSLCREFEKHGMRFFKRGKKALHVSSIRPRAISAGVALSPEVQRIVDYVIANPGRKVVDMLDSLVEDFTKPDPKADKAAPKEEVPLSDGAKKVLSNLRWLTSEGYVLEFADTKLHIGKGPRPDQPASKKSTKKAAKKKAAKSEVKTEATPGGDAPAEAKGEAEAKTEEKAEAEAVPAEVAPKAEPAEAAKPDAEPTTEVVEAEVPSEDASEPAAEEVTPEVVAEEAAEPEVAKATEVAEPEVSPAEEPEEVPAAESVPEEAATDTPVEDAPEKTEPKGE